MLLGAATTAMALPPREEEQVNASEVIFIAGKPHVDLGEGVLEPLRTRRADGQTIYYRWVRYDQEFGYVAEPPPKPKAGDELPYTWGVAADARPYYSPFNAVIETRIAGDFDGWEGNSAFTMENGQVWQQTDGRTARTRMQHPRVYLFRQNGYYEMRVEGMRDSIRVRRER
ncbi:hypothetical protein [Stenotrophomonas sp. SY1]|uniref:hypothetical protein n=1 Tax=Stenotrophomonas sp. SY1 TaxID=477235 RepID=UPI001E4288D9|nr:hypothetical protein [Stenotrophomonas sp. SY1]MCD9086826.1 hypothetical protein [Stenotrophomonas sp. SY1]